MKEKLGFKTQHGFVGRGTPYCIAEIGSNHCGELNKAIELVKAAKLAGADCVKFQKKDVDSLYTQKMKDMLYDNPVSFGKTYYEHKKALELKETDLVVLKGIADENELDFLVTPFDIPSADLLEKIGVRYYKIGSGDLTNIPMIQYICQFKKPIFLSTGGGSLKDVRRAYETIKNYNNSLVLFHCVSSYPCDYTNLNLLVIKEYFREFDKAIIGYSGHDTGILAPTLAYMLGATVIEKHFTINRNWKGTDQAFSLEPHGFQKMVRDLNRIRLALGSSEKRLNPYENEPIRKMAKSLYSTKSLPVGHVLTKEDICIKSPSNGLPPYMFTTLIGCEVIQALQEEESFSVVNVRIGVSAKGETVQVRG